MTKDNFIKAIVWNNPEQVHDNLVSLGILPTDADISIDNIGIGIDSAVNEHGEGVLPALLDAPINPEGHYAGELYGIQDANSNRAILESLTEPTLTLNRGLGGIKSNINVNGGGGQPTPSWQLMLNQKLGQFNFTAKDAFYVVGTAFLFIAGIFLIKKL